MRGSGRGAPADTAVGEGVGVVVCGVVVVGAGALAVVCDVELEHAVRNSNVLANAIVKNTLAVVCTCKR